MQKILQLIYFSISVGLTRGVFVVLLFIIDYKYDEFFTGEFSSNLALLSLIIFLSFFGGNVSIYREGSSNIKKAKNLFNTHVFCGFFLLTILYQSDLVNKFIYSIALLSLICDLSETFFRSIKKDFNMMLVTLIKFIVLTLSYYFLEFNEATNFIFSISISSFILTFLFLGKLNLKNYTRIKSYSFHSLIIGISAWAINSSDKYMSSYFISFDDLRIYSITYSIAAPVLLIGGVFNLIYSREYFKNNNTFNHYFFKFIKLTILNLIIVSIFQCIIFHYFYSSFDIYNLIFINISMCLILIYGFLQLPYIKSRNMIEIIKISAISGLFNIVSNIIFLQVFGWKILYLTTLLTSVLSLILIILNKKNNETFNNLS
jgi:hypothetical protein